MPSNQSPTFSESQKRSLLRLQGMLHHKRLCIRAGSTTEERITQYNLINSPKLTTEESALLRKSSQDVVGWIYQNSGALYKIVYSVAKKNAQLLRNNYYDADELFNILVLESMRILYNYDFNNAKQAQPLTYLIHTLNIRKHTLLALDVPTSDDMSLYYSE